MLSSSVERSLHVATAVFTIIVLGGALNPIDPIQQADAATALASTISSWNNVCDDCEVQAATTLNVPAMTNDATSNGQPEVIFTMTNLLISGQLTIDCNGNPWANGKPLRFKVINGTNTATINLFFKIQGTLDLGSTVEIVSGTYYLAFNALRFFQVSLQISGNSSIRIQSNTFILKTVGSTSQMYIWDVSRIAMASSSSIVHSDNILSLDGAVSTSSTFFNFVYVFISSGCLSMSSTSMFLINNNTFIAGTFNASGPFTILGIHIRACVPTLSDSSLTLSDNTFSFIGSTIMGLLSTAWIYSDTSGTISLASGGSWVLSQNRVLVSNATIGNSAYLQTLYFFGGFDVDGVNSKLTITETTVTLRNVSAVSGSLFIYSIDVTGAIAILNFALLKVADCQVLIEDDTTIGNEMRIHLVRSNSLRILSQGEVRLNDNIISSTAVVTSPNGSSVFLLRTLAASNYYQASISLSRNIIAVRNESTYIAKMAAGTNMTSSNITLVGNRLWSAHLDTFLLSSGSTLNTTTVCNNSVNDVVCVVGTGGHLTGEYSCAPPSPAPQLIVTDICGATSTLSKPQTSTQSRPPTATCNSTASQSWRPTATYTNSNAVTLSATLSYSALKTASASKTAISTSTHTPAHTSTQTSTQTPAHTLTQTPAHTSTQTPAHTPTQTLTHTPAHTSTQTSAHTLTHFISVSTSRTPLKSSFSHSLSQSDAHTQSQAPICPSHAPPCLYARSASVQSTSSSTSRVVPQNTSSCNAGGSGLYLTIPYSLWSGSGFKIRIDLHAPLLDFFDNGTHLPALNSVAEGVLRHRSIVTTDGTTLWAEMGVAYTGPVSRSARTVTIDVPLSQHYLSCRFSTFGGDATFLIDLHLLEASPIPDALQTVVDVGVGMGVLMAVPSAVVKAGMMGTVMGMLRCSEFEPEVEVGFVANPFGWAPGRTALQYHRGSVSLGLVCIGICWVLATLAVMGVKVCSTDVHTWADAFVTLRLPGIPLVAVLLVSEVCMSSATSMVLFAESKPSDVAMGLFSIIPLFGYMAMFLHNVWTCSRYIEIVPTSETMAERNVSGLLYRVLHYALEPTHDIVVLGPRQCEYDANNKKERANAQWLRCNFYFVADRRWPLFGALEAVGGIIVNMLEGIPMATENRALCIARPACVVVISGGLLVLLLWKVPNAVRLQQLCSVVVAVGLTLASIIATANAVSPAESLETATGFIGAVTVCASMLLGIVEMVVLLMTYFPSSREVLSLRSRGLEAIVTRSKAIHAVAAVAMLHVPLITVLVPPTQLPNNPPTLYTLPTEANSNPENTPQPGLEPSLLTQPPQPHAPVQEDSGVEDSDQMADGEEEVIQQILEDLDAFEMRIRDDPLRLDEG